MPEYKIDKSREPIEIEVQGTEGSTRNLKEIITRASDIRHTRGIGYLADVMKRALESIESIMEAPILTDEDRLGLELCINFKKQMEIALKQEKLAKHCYSCKEALNGAYFLVEHARIDESHPNQDDKLLFTHAYCSQCYKNIPHTNKDIRKLNESLRDAGFTLQQVHEIFNIFYEDKDRLLNTLKREEIDCGCLACDGSCDAHGGDKCANHPECADQYKKMNRKRLINAFKRIEQVGDHLKWVVHCLYMKSEAKSRKTGTSEADHGTDLLRRMYNDTLKLISIGRRNAYRFDISDLKTFMDENKICPQCGTDLIKNEYDFEGCYQYSCPNTECDYISEPYKLEKKQEDAKR